MLIHFTLKDILRNCQMSWWGTQRLLFFEVSGRQLNKQAGILQSSWSTSGPCDCQFGDMPYVLGHCGQMYWRAVSNISHNLKVRKANLQIIVIVTELILSYAFLCNLFQDEKPQRYIHLKKANVSLQQHPEGQLVYILL